MLFRYFPNRESACTRDAEDAVPYDEMQRL